MPTLELSGQSYELRADFAQLVALEEFFGQPLLQIAEPFLNGEASLTETEQTLAIILDWPPPARAGLGDEIVASGLGQTLIVLQKYFLAALGIEKSPSPCGRG